MRLIYFDEVKYQKGSQPYYWLAGIVVTPEAIWRLENALNDLSKAVFKLSVLTDSTEFHAADIFHRKKNFKSWSDIEARISVLTRLTDILNSEKDLARIYTRIDPAKMIASSDGIEDKAFMFFVERVEQYLRGQSSPGMLIGDRENERVSKQFTETLSHYRAHGTSYYFGIELTRLIDTVHFTNSHHSRMLQLADLYVWVLQLCENFSEDKYPANRVVSHVRENTDILSPSKYKIWPTDKSWYSVGGS